MVHTRPPHSHHWHLSICSQEVTTCFTLASVSNCVPVRRFSRALQRWKWLGPILQTWLVNGYGMTAGRLLTTLPNIHLHYDELDNCPDGLKHVGDIKHSWLVWTAVYRVGFNFMMFVRDLRLSQRWWLLSSGTCSSAVWQTRTRDLCRGIFCHHFHEDGCSKHNYLYQITWCHILKTYLHNLLIKYNAFGITWLAEE
jgi:hypothetical protein